MTSREPRPRVLVTRAAAQADELISALDELGLEPVHVPAIEVAFDGSAEDLGRAAAALRTYAWVVVTSANGARAILAARNVWAPQLGGPGWAAIGSASAAVLTDAGVSVAFKPSRSQGAAMAAELPLEPGDRILVVRGDLADGGLAARLRARGAEVDDVVAYRTRIAPPASGPLLRAAMEGGSIAALTLASGSAVRGLLALAEAEALDVTAIPAVCVGPETERAAAAAGFRIVAVAALPDAHALAAAAAAALAPRPLEIA